MAEAKKKPEPSKEDKAKEIEKVEVTFLANYIAPRGPGINGAKGDVKTYPMSAALKACVEEGIVKVGRHTVEEKRETATRSAE